MNEIIGELLPPTRLMLTPGPSNMDARVYRALSTPLVGHMDPWFIEMMGDVQSLLRRVFQTQNRITFPISASGSGGIEAAVLNPLEEGDECIVCSNGWFSERMAVIAERSPGVKVIRVEAPYGSTVDPEDVRRAGKGRKSNSSASRTARLPAVSRSASPISAKSRMSLALCSSWTQWPRSQACRSILIAKKLISASAAHKKRSARRRECRPSP
jgi:hypothetical protein